MAAAYPFHAAYQTPSPAYRTPSPAYQYPAHVESMFQAAPMVYPNMPVAAPGLVYPMTLPGYPTPGMIQYPSAADRRPSSPVKQYLPMQPNMPPTIRTRPNTPVHIPVHTPVHTPFHTPVPSRIPTPVPSIIPTQEWLLDTLKRYIFTHRGILFGDYPKYEIRKKDSTDKFHKRIAELYPSYEYNITKEWISGAIANPEFLPEYAERLDTFPSTSEFRIAINESDLQNLAKDIDGTIKPYFDIRVESDRILDTNVRKIILGFYNYLIPEGQRVMFYTDKTYSTTPVGFPIPQSELKYQHDYLTYDGNVYSVLDTYPYNGNVFQNASVDSSINLFEIVNNIRNGIVIFMAYVDMEECRELILAARNKDKYENQEKKTGQQSLVFDKFSSPRVKLDFYIKIWKPTNNASTDASADAGVDAGADASTDASADAGVDAGVDVSACPRCRCKVVIESGDLVCTTKCCRRTMHPSCLLELYCQEGTPHSEFRCDKCSIKRMDKYGKNTEMLMALCFTGF